MEKDLSSPHFKKMGSLQSSTEQSGLSYKIQPTPFGIGCEHLPMLTGAPQVQLTDSASDSSS